jgi:hypothetical protein
MRRVACVAAVLVFAACAEPGYDAQKMQTELRRAGVPADHARCITDRIENEFPDLNQLGSHSDPTPDEQARADAIVHACGVTTTTRPR